MVKQRRWYINTIMAGITRILFADAPAMSR
jgi:hypothetical protein